MFSTSFITATVLAGAAMVAAQTVTLPINVLANAAVCPATAGGDVSAGVLAVVNFVETATANIDLAGITTSASIPVDLEVCLCVGANVELGAITLPAPLQAAAEVTLTNFVAENALVNTVAAAVNNILQLTGSTLDIALTPTSQTDCTCPVGATPTCANAVCSCICPTGFFYDATTNQCILNGSGLARRSVARRFSSFQDRQAKRSEVIARSAHRA